MKKFLGMLAIAGVLVACDNNSTTDSTKKDSSSTTTTTTTDNTTVKPAVGDSGSTKMMTDTTKK